MATLLTNRKMDPALRARVEKSISGRTSPEAAAARLRAILRFASIIVFVVAVVWIAGKRRETGHALELQRAGVLDAFSSRTANVGEEDRGAIARDEAVLVRLAGPWEGDLATPTSIGRSIVYVRGPIESFTSAASIEKAAAASLDDAFARCFVDPPRSRSERDVLPKVRAIYTGPAAGKVERLADAYSARRVMSPAWQARVRAAQTEKELAALRSEVEHTPFERARSVWRAELLLVVMDEPGDANAPAELDGERPHEVRVALVDTKTGTPLLRMRKRVDPSAWSVGARPDYAAGLDACALAFDARALLGSR
jgi:hypothetical protein